MFQSQYKAFSEFVSIDTPLEECINVGAFVASCEQSIKIPQVDVTVCTPSETFVQVVVTGNYIQ
jgi:hypothetical protein